MIGLAAKIPIPRHESLYIFAKGWLKPFVTWVSAALPAMGAALAGIRAQGDFVVSADRSTRTAERLRALGAQLAKERANPSFDRTRALVLEAASAMNADLGLWSSLYRHRPLSLP